MYFLDDLYRLPKMKQRKKTAYDNMIEYQNTLADLITSEMNIFKWEGLPDTVNVRVLERNLLIRGAAMIAEVNGALVALTCCPDGNININGDPIGAYGYGLNGFNKHFNLFVEGADESSLLKKSVSGNTLAVKPNAVMIRDNVLNYPYIYMLERRAQSIADAQRSLDVVARMLKSPAIISCEDRSIENVKRILEDVDTNTAYIVGMGSNPMQTFQVLDSGVKSQTLIDLWNYRDNVKNETREMIGIVNNPQQDKRERLLTDEISSNNQQTALNIDKRLHWREKACEQINMLFNINCSCKVDNDFMSMEDNINEGDKGNEKDDDRNAPY